MQHLRDGHGDEIRAWRRALDPHAKFALLLTDLRQYCRKVDLDVDIKALWKSLDTDNTGQFLLEEIATDSAAILANFKFWCFHIAGSCTDLWEKAEIKKARRDPGLNGTWVSDKKIMRGCFAEALRNLGWPESTDPDTASKNRAKLSAMLDFFGGGFICKADLAWLDKWQPREWLHSAPSAKAWSAIRTLCLQEYKHPLRAWRQAFDTDDSNVISWLEFRRACDKLGFLGDVAGAWRHLDQDASGLISMKEFDPPSAELLMSFKNWADNNFGSVELAFKALDVDGSRSVTFGELKRACHKLCWEGDIRILFDCLDLNYAEGGKRTLTLDEISFLDHWQWDALEDPDVEPTKDVAKKPSKFRSRPGTSLEADWSKPSLQPISRPASEPSLHKCPEKTEGSGTCPQGDCWDRFERCLVAHRHRNGGGGRQRNRPAMVGRQALPDLEWGKHRSQRSICLPERVARRQKKCAILNLSHSSDVSLVL